MIALRYFLGRDCPIPEAGHRSAAVTGWPQATRRVEERAPAREQRSALTARTMGYDQEKRQALPYVASPPFAGLSSGLTVTTNTLRVKCSPKSGPSLRA